MDLGADYMDQDSPLYWAEINVAITWEISARSMFWSRSLTTNFAASSNYKMLGQQGKIVIEVLLEFYGINFVL